MTNTQERFYSERLYLRPLREEDCTERYLSWFRDPEITRFLEVRELTREEVIRFLRDGMETKSYFMYALCAREGDLHIGNVKIGPINHRHGVSDYSLIIGEKAFWGKGYATEATKLSTSVGFSEHGIRKFSSGPYATHYGSLLMLLKAGWVIEGTLRQQFIWEGKITDKICLAYFNPKFLCADNEPPPQPMLDSPADKK
jgi:[ribosomal protein S5]-alanine N-acetyltransferase